MQPKLCTKCKKNIAVVFITKIENGVTMNEGYCLKCARSLGTPQIDAAVKQMGISGGVVTRFHQAAVKDITAMPSRCSGLVIVMPLRKGCA